MPQLQPYLSFKGKCAEAMTFYKECLGGELELKYVKDAPASAGDGGAGDNVMHGTLKNGDLLFFGSDMMYDEPVPGNMMTLCVNTETEEQLRTMFGKLAAGGQVTSEPKLEFWGDIFGTLTDKYGIQWMFNYSKSTQS